MTQSLDIVVSVYNDESTIEAFFEAVTEEIDRLPLNTRLVFVCDGSPDKSWEQLERLVALRDDVVAIELSRNFGQHIAVSAGLDFATADYVIVMDSDLQDPPAVIPAIIEQLQEGVDIVYTRRASQTRSATRPTTSRLFWKAIRILGGRQIVGDQLMLRGMRQSYVRAFRSLKERHRLIAGLSAWLGFRSVVLDVEPGLGLRSDSNYTWKRLAGLAIDATTSLSIVPLRLATGLGLIVTAASFLYGAFVLVSAMAGARLQSGFPTLAILVSALGGIQLMILGILGEYVGRTLQESQRRPLYLARQVIGPADAPTTYNLPLPPEPRRVTDVQGP